VHNPACSAVVNGDPHFVGLGGQRFRIDGEPGKVYNLVSTADLQLNALFGTSKGPHNYTIIDEIGIRVGNDTVFMSRWAHLRINNDPMGEVASQLLSDGESVVTRDMAKTNQGQTLRTKDFFLRIIPRGYEADLKEFKMFREGSEEVHGLLGQTWSADKWPQSAFETEMNNERAIFNILDGDSMDDYEVKDGLFGVEFAFNRFDHHFFSIHPVVPGLSSSNKK